jgi:hypothetical protein
MILLSELRLNALKRTRANETGLVAVVLVCPSASTHAKVGCHPPICHPACPRLPWDRSVPGFPATRPSPAATCAAFFRESCMKFANATNLYRKSGVAELQFALTEKRNPEAILPRKIRCARKRTADPSATLGMTNWRPHLGMGRNGWTEPTN